MRIISDMIENMDEELESARRYAEDYLTLRAKNSPTAGRYKQMATEEIQHATWIHERLVDEISDLRNVYTPPVEMEERWNKEHKSYIEDVTFVKTMLAI